MRFVGVLAAAILVMGAPAWAESLQASFDLTKPGVFSGADINPNAYLIPGAVSWSSGASAYNGAQIELTYDFAGYGLTATSTFMAGAFAYLANGTNNDFVVGQISLLGESGSAIQTKAKTDLDCCGQIGLSAYFDPTTFYGVRATFTVTSYNEPRALTAPNLIVCCTTGSGFQLVALSPAPEPAAWVMMLAGFGLVGGAMRYGAGRKRPLPARAA